jgi:hypothetical protein
VLKKQINLSKNLNLETQAFENARLDEICKKKTINPIERNKIFYEER